MLSLSIAYVCMHIIFHHSVCMYVYMHLHRGKLSLPHSNELEPLWFVLKVALGDVWHLEKCMYVCMVLICMYVWYTYMCVCMYVCMNICMYSMYVCIYVRAYVCIYVSAVRLNVCICLCMYVCMYCMYVYVCMGVAPPWVWGIREFLCMECDRQEWQRWGKSWTPGDPTPAGMPYS